MFSRDLKDFTCRTPRSISEAFGPYSTQKLSAPRRKARFAPIVWMLVYGVMIALIWYGCILSRSV